MVKRFCYPICFFVVEKKHYLCMYDLYVSSLITNIFL